VAGLKRRSKRAASEEDHQFDLQAFKAGLADECPKCGIDFADLINDGISAEIHLMNCNDQEAHKQHKAKKDAKRKKHDARDEAQAAQNDAESKAAWEFLGKNNDQLYLLTEGQLQKELKEKGLKSKAGDDNADIIAALVNRERSLVVRDGSAANAAGDSAKSLPSLSTLQRMDAYELRAVLASHGMGGKKLKSMSKRKMLDLLEDKMYKNYDDDAKIEEVIELHDDDCGREKLVKRTKKIAIEVDDDDTGSDGDWNPDS